MQAGEAPTEDVERDWERLERDRSQLWDMKRQVIFLKIMPHVSSNSHRLPTTTCFCFTANKYATGDVSQRM